MTTIDELKKLYACCMGCKNTSKECPSISEDKEINPVPRGFYFKSPQIKILAVGKNPSHPQEDETGRYVNKKGLDVVNAHLTFMGELFQKRTHIFHKNLSRYLSKILGLREDEIFTQAAYTNLVKCSTVNKQAKIDDKTINVCFEKFFLKELQLFKPNAILALGREVESFLKEHYQPNQLGIPTRHIAYVQHPTYTMSRQREDEELSWIKKEIKERTRAL